MAITATIARMIVSDRFESLDTLSELTYSSLMLLATLASEGAQPNQSRLRPARYYRPLMHRTGMRPNTGKSSSGFLP
jgi:hypothetical protein